MRKPGLAALALLLLVPVALPATAAGRTLVICAPGYPGTTAQARPVMDSFAAAAARAAGQSPGSLAAVYHEREEPGLARMGQEDAILALVPLPFFLEHGPALALSPRLQVVREAGARETYTLVAKKGGVGNAGSLAGYEIAASSGYSPAFVRGPALGTWGAIPVSATVKFAPAVLSALRRAAAGDKVAVLLDASQAAAMASLPFASDLEAVYVSKPWPGTLLCTIGRRAKDPAVEGLIGALAGLQKTPDGAEALKAMQMVRFETADLAGIDRARKSFEAAAGR